MGLLPKLIVTVDWQLAGRQHEHEHFIQVRGSKLQKLFNIKVKSIHLVNSSAIIGYPAAM